MNFFTPNLVCFVVGVGASHSIGALATPAFSKLADKPWTRTNYWAHYVTKTLLPILEAAMSACGARRAGGRNSRNRI